jgi:hypothetical protein
MAILFTALIGCSVTSIDDDIGTAADVLIDQKTWKARWLVVRLGGWLLERKVLVCPSFIVGEESGSRPGKIAGSNAIRLTTALKTCPDMFDDEPVSQQSEMNLYASPGSDPLWGGSGFFGEYSGDAAKDALGRRPDQGDPNLRSCHALIGYHLCATDGSIGHLQDFLLDDRMGSIDSIIVDTKDWRSGQRVLLPPQLITGIGWSDQQVRVSISRGQVKASPLWVARPG